MKFISFASSSHGNCALVSYKNTNILVDCGLSKKKIDENLYNHGLGFCDIDAILITHSHSDHILGIDAVLKKHKIDVLSQRETLIEISKKCINKNVIVDDECFKIIRPINDLNADTFIGIKDIKVKPIKGFHDVPSVFYKFYCGDTIFAIVTDLGKYTNQIISALSDVNYLMLECNYDLNALIENDTYSEQLKSRILSENGHLSNVNCSEIIMKLASPSLKKVYLSHISDQTNSEEHALEFVNDYLSKNYCGENRLPHIEICKRLSETIILDE